MRSASSLIVVALACALVLAQVVDPVAAETSEAQDAVEELIGNARATSALEPGPREDALRELARSEPLAVYEAVDRLLQDEPASTDWELAGRLAAAYDAVVGEDTLGRRVATFRGWTADQRRRRRDALTSKVEGRARFGDGALDDALERFRTAAATLGELGDLREQARCLSNAGAVHAVAGRAQQALDLLDAAQAVAARVGDREMVAYIANNRAFALESLGDLEGAGAALAGALPVARRMGDRLLEGGLLLQIAGFDLRLGRLDEAAASYGDALEAGSETDEPEMQVNALGGLALVARRRGRGDETLQLLRRAVDIARAADRPAVEVPVVLDLVAELVAGERLDRAEQLLARVDELTATMDSPMLVARVDVERARLLIARGRLDDALAAAERAQAIATTLDEVWLEGAIAGVRGVAAFYLGRYDTAIGETRRSADIAESLGRTAEEEAARESLGYMLAYLGDMVAAAGELERATGLSEAFGGRRQQAGALHAVGVMRHRVGDDDASRAALHRALELLGNGDAGRRAEILLDLATVELEADRPTDADANDLLRRAERAAVDSGDEAGLVRVRLVEAWALLERGKVDAAADVLDAMTADSDRLEPASRWRRHVLRGRIAERRGDGGAAESAYAAAVADVERMRGGARVEPWRAALLEDRVEPYRRLAGIRLDRGRIEDAWTAARMAKARTFAERLTDVRFAAHAGPPEADTSALQSVRPTPATELARLLGPDELLVDWYELPRGWVAFLLDRKDLRVIEMTPDSSVLGGLAATLRHPGRPQPADAAVTGIWNKAAAGLGRIVLDPLAQGVGRAKHLLLVPSGPLEGLPLAALELEGRPLVATHDVSVLPAAEALLSRARARAVSSGALILGVPDGLPNGPRLTGAEREARRIAEIAGDEAHLLVGRGATEDAFVAAAPRAERIFISAHGVTNAILPARSYVALMPGARGDGRLEATEIAELPLSASVVVLAGCGTARDAAMARPGAPGDERVGLVRGFLRAGAANVIATLWELDDEAASHIVPAVAQAMREERSPAAALARVQRAMIDGRVGAERAERWRHPFHWAGLVSYGAGTAVPSDAAGVPFPRSGRAERGNDGSDQD